MTEPIVRSEPLGGTPLARAALDGLRAEWYPEIPRSAAAWKARSEAVRASIGRDWWDAIRPALSASGAAGARLARVVSGRGVLVTTGQQPGLFGGPIYTWSKALSALTLADEIEAATGIPAAPLFWAANDDADFAEASWTAVAVPGGAERLTVSAGAPLGRTMADMPLGDVGPAFAALLRACGATLDARPVDAVRAAYRDGATVGGAYLSLLRELFEPLGIAVLDAAHASVAESARPFLLRALDRANDEASDVVFAVSIEARHFGRLSADQRAAVFTARPGYSGDDLLGDLGRQSTGGQIVEKEQGSRALDQDVVDAVVHQVGTYRVVPAGHESDLELRADTVSAGDQHRFRQPSGI